MTTPTVMAAMMAQGFHEGCSRRKRNAKSRTKAREEDLHIVRKVRVTKRRDVLPRPMSRDVAMPQGRRRVAERKGVMRGLEGALISETSGAGGFGRRPG